MNARTRFSTLAGSALLLAFSGPALAQTPAVVDPLAPVAPLEPAAAPAPPAAPAAPAANADAEAEAMALALAQGSGSDATTAAVADAEEFKLNIYGFADFTYTARLNDFAFASPYPTFLVGNLNLYVGAELGGGWRTLTEFRLLYLPHGNTPASGGARTDTTASDPADLARPLHWGGVEIERAWLEYSAHPLLTIQAGQWLTPYGIWNVDHGSPVIIGVRRPYVVGEQMLPERQTGVQIYGSYLAGQTEIGYHLGLSNGRGPIDSYMDLDKNKAITARLSISNDSPLGNITLGGTLYSGRYTDRTSSFYVDPSGALGVSYVASQVYDELGLAADLRWVWEDLTLQGEYISRETVYPRDDVRAPAFPLPGVPNGYVPDFRSTGWYVMGAYRLPWLNIMPFFGGESYHANQELVNNAAAIWGGLNVRPVPRVVLKAQYTQSWFLEPLHFPLVGASGLKALDLQASWSF
jgi:hypothetical protein